ncbi:10448_t:CDS:1 [Ambispora gerdemannii]|uniref:10448_t:CDS:1 n=1 Tax=Ambispora gerdemannii TaxID=144530 RepID=A0A9N8ZRX4_9GLOM|nr:10448_t:CDS:1 [Ambispora gerdemannii]
MASFLPNDCLTDIFEILSEDKITLYSCLLVNRQWCNSVVPFLWRKPFDLLKYLTYNKLSTRHPKLIHSYVACLSEEEREMLIRSGIKIPTDFPPTAFNYSAFLRHLDISELYHATSLWCMYIDCIYPVTGDNDEKVYNNSSTRYSECVGCYTAMRIKLARRGPEKRRQRQVEQEERNFDLTELMLNQAQPPPTGKVYLVWQSLCKMFMRRCLILKYLCITSPYRQPDDYYMVSAYPGAVKCLSHLQYFECGGRFSKSQVLETISKACRNLQTIKYYMYPKENNQMTMNEVNSLIELIQVQSSLTEFIIIRGGTRLGNIIMTLGSSQATSLKRLEFVRCDFEHFNWLKELSGFINLKELVFDGCRNLSNNLISTSDTSSFPQLTLLSSLNGILSADVWNALIGRSGSSLQILDTGRGMSSGLWQDHMSVLETIGMHCPNITHFTSYTFVGVTPKLFETISGFHQLEELTIALDRFSEYEGRGLCVNKFLTLLAVHLAPTVRFLHVVTKKPCNVDSLRAFVRQFRGNFKFFGMKELWDVDVGTYAGIFRELNSVLLPLDMYSSRIREIKTPGIFLCR